MKWLLSLFSFVALSAYAEEGVQYVTLDTGHRVWTKRVGTGPIAILTLHGGPGCTHEYFECLEEHLPLDRYQVIYYDQLDSHLSDQPNDPSLWTIERYVEEVEQVRQALQLDQFILYGQSWGSMLAIDYAVRYPTHLRGLILSNMTASIASYEAYLGQVRAALPQDVQEEMSRYEQAGDFTNPAYQKLLFEKVYVHCVCRCDPWPEPVVRSLSHWNPHVYNVMQGPSEFVIVGNFKHWDRWADLPHIDVPTLVIGGRYDTMNPEDLKKMGRLLPQGQTVICENGSHLSMFDDAATYFEAVKAFLP